MPELPWLEVYNGETTSKRSVRNASKEFALRVAEALDAIGCPRRVH